MYGSFDQLPDHSLHSFDDCIAFQGYFLDHVSRTFALTIPQLPPPLHLVVGNAYLLCRIADTIEDEPNLTIQQKDMFADLFSSVVQGEKESSDFAAKLSGVLSTATSTSEKELIARTSKVLAITHSFSKVQRTALERCVAIMTKGMAKFQRRACPAGLKDLSELDQYCYYVAGVVGTMLTDLFCDYSPEINKHREELQNLAIMFGQGLQMTNILKDTWDDRQRGVCWLPREVFQKYGIDLASVHSADPSLSDGIQDLVVIAYHNLEGALRYTLLIPPNETGIRRHCLSALGMAVLTLRKIHKNPSFINGNQVKISRSSVKFILFITNLLVRSNLGLKILFVILTYGLKGVKRTNISD